MEKKDYDKFYREALPMDCWLVWIKDGDYQPELREIATTETEAKRAKINIEANYRLERRRGLYRVWIEPSVLNHIFASKYQGF